MDKQWTVLPATPDQIERVRQECRRMVRRRAALSASVAAVPIPGVDVMSDLSLFTLLVNDVNQAFGLSEAQIDRLKPSHKVLAYQVAAGMGGMMVGRYLTREVVLALFKRAGARMLAKSAARFVPLAGALASAAIGFTVFRKLGYEHVEACVSVARELAGAGPA